MSRFDRTYFESLYERNPDPWKFRDSAYEQGKYAVTIASLARPHYAKALELGCSIGVLTQRLAGICDEVVAVDTSTRALAAARASCSGMNVDFRQAHLPDGDWGTGFDLVVLSEILYYLDVRALERLARRVEDAMLAGAECIAVHWIGETDYPLSGDRASELFLKLWPGPSLLHRRTTHYRIDGWRPRETCLCDSCCSAQPGSFAGTAMKARQQLRISLRYGNCRAFFASDRPALPR